MKKLLVISNLSISFTQYFSGSKQRVIEPVKELNLEVGSGEIVAVVGASGSGKSLLAHAILDLLPVNSTVSYKMKYKGTEVTQEELRKLRGRQIRYIPQSVQYLDPTRKIGKQLSSSGKDLTKREAEQLLELFSLDKKVYHMYPHELSGGMLRRVLFATCYGEDVELVIADEPTPGIHPAALKEILKQFQSFREKGISVIFITHDMDSAIKIADRVAVFLDGRVESVATPEQFIKGSVKNDYALKLWRSQPVNSFMEVV